MDDGLAALRAALDERDKLRGFTTRLESLKAEGSLSPVEYATGSADYERRIATATSRIQALKAALGKELEATERERDMCRLKLKSAETRHLAEETTVAQVEAEKRKWTTHQKRIAERREGLATALAAETLAELGNAESVLPSAPTATTTPPEFTAEPAGKSFPSAGAARITRPGWTRLRIASLVAAVVLFVSVRLAWLAPTEALGAGIRAEAGASVTFIAGLGGILCGLCAIGFTFVRTARTRGLLHAIAGCLALLALAAAIALGELPLHDSYFRELVVLRECFCAYIAAAVGLGVMGFMQTATLSLRPRHPGVHKD
jgi:hypothetical protein